MFKIHYSLRCDSLTSQLQLYSAMSFFLYNTLFNMMTNRNIRIMIIISTTEIRFPQTSPAYHC